MNVCVKCHVETEFHCAFYGSHFSQKHTFLKSWVKKVKDQADGWNLSVVFQAPGMTSYSNLTSGFWSLTVSIRLFQDQSTVIKQVQVPNILEKKNTDSAVMMDKALTYELNE